MVGIGLIELIILVAVVVAVGFVLVGVARRGTGFRFGHAKLACPHCGKETPAHTGKCQHCGASFV